MKIERIAVSVFRVPIEIPVATSFGIMRDRPAVFVQLTAEDGAFGWGEIFANWPAAGAEHRARLLMLDIADLVFESRADTPEITWETLTHQTRIRAQQAGEWGPFQQVLAGLDTALHDMAARRAGLSLARYLNPSAEEAVPCYASGIASSKAAAQVASARADGFSAFKIKVGFNDVTDLETLGAVSDDLGSGERLFADANQAWDVPRAVAFMQQADAFGLGWIEEPIPADSPRSDWASLADNIKTPIAVGENIAGDVAFTQAIEAGHFAYLQPDVAKWGGVTGCLRVARTALQAGRIYCPHFLGGGIGLRASAHVLAAAGGPGVLEVDVNPNPLRDAFEGEAMSGGDWTLGTAAGLGIETLPQALGPYQTLSLEKTRVS